MRILITGATGLVGQNIGINLVKQGHEVFVITRDQKKVKKNCPFPCTSIEGDLNRGSVNLNSFNSFDSVINLMGEPIATGRWTSDKKEKLRSSRINSTLNLIESLKTCSKFPASFISTSAIGFYGSCGEHIIHEDQGPAKGFLGQLCKDWEDSALKIQTVSPSTRVVIARIGIVISREGGALNEILPLFKNGLGGPISDGKQWMSWIHLNDVIAFYIQAISDSSIYGPYNLVAPNPVTNKEFTAVLGKTINSSTLLPTPSFALKIAFGEKSKILLDSQRVSSTRILNHFNFQFKKLEDALTAELIDDQNGNELFKAKQYIGKTPEELFPFFSEAKNLEKITPSSLNFKIVSTSTDKIDQGTIINYLLKIHGIPMNWKTEITNWSPPNQFIDNQLKGPYALWHHTHIFEKLGPGTLMIDKVRFKLPLGKLGKIFGLWLVLKDIQKIFDYRFKIVNQIFNNSEVKSSNES